MRIITHTCSDCGTVVAGNVLEEHRVMKCPRFDCEEILRFEALPAEDRKYVLENRDAYDI